MRGTLLRFVDYPAKKASLSAVLSAERQIFHQIILREVKGLLFKGRSLLLQIVSDKNSTMRDQYYSIFVRNFVFYKWV
jgi:hypothetical protein